MVGSDQCVSMALVRECGESGVAVAAVLGSTANTLLQLVCQASGLSGEVLGTDSTESGDLRSRSCLKQKQLGFLISFLFFGGRSLLSFEEGGVDLRCRRARQPCHSSKNFR